MSKVKRIVNGTVQEVDDNQMVKTIEDGVVVEKPYGQYTSEKKNSVGNGLNTSSNTSTASPSSIPLVSGPEAFNGRNVKGQLIVNEKNNPDWIKPTETLPIEQTKFKNPLFPFSLPDNITYTPALLDSQELEEYANKKNALPAPYLPNPVTDAQLVKSIVESRNDDAVMRQRAKDFLIKDATNDASTDNKNINADNFPSVDEYFHDAKTKTVNEIQSLRSDLDELGAVAGDLGNPQINQKLQQIQELNTHLQELKKYSNVFIKEQAEKEIKPEDFKDYSDYLKAIGRKVNSINNYDGVKKKEESILNGDEDSRSKTVRENEDYNYELAGISALQSNIINDYSTNKIDEATARQKLAQLTVNNQTLEDRYPQAALDNIRKYLGDYIAQKRKEKDSGISSAWNNIVSAAPSEDEITTAIHDIRANNQVQISDDQEKSLVASPDKIPLTSMLGHLYKSTILKATQTVRSIFGADNEERKLDFRDPSLYQQVQPSEIPLPTPVGDKNVVRMEPNPNAGQHADVLSWATANSVADVAGTIASYVALNKAFGTVAQKLLGGIAGAETVGYTTSLAGDIKPITALTAEQTSLASNVLSSTYLNYYDKLDAAKELTNDKNKQMAYALSSSLITGLVFSEINPGKILSGASGVEEKAMGEKFIQKLIEGNGQLEPEKMKAFFSNWATSTAKDLGHNISLVKANQIADIALDRLTNKDALQNRNVMDELFGNLPSDIISFLPFSAIAGYQQADANIGVRNAVRMAITDPVTFESGMMENVKAGKISPQDAQDKINYIKGLVNVYRGKDLNTDKLLSLSTEDRYAYANNLLQENRIKKNIEGMSDDLQIAEENKKIESLQSQRQKILQNVPDQNQLPVSATEGQTAESSVAPNQPEAPAAESPEAKAAKDILGTGKPIFTDFDGTAFKDGKLTPIGEELKSRIENGEDVTVLTARKGERNVDFISEKLGIDKDKIKSGLSPDDKASFLTPDATYIDDNPANRDAAAKVGIQAIDPNAKIADAIQPNEITVGEMIDKVGSYKGEKGQFFQDGQSVIFKVDGKNREYELGNVDELKNTPISSFGIKNEQSVVNVNDAGNIQVRGSEYINNYSDPLAAINRDADGNVTSVNLETPDGKKRAFRGNIAEDIAYQIHLKDITKDNETTKQFEQFINRDEIAPAIHTGLSEIAKTETTGNNDQVQPAERTKIEPSSAEDLFQQRKGEGKLGVFKNMEPKEAIKMIADQAQNLTSDGKFDKPELAQQSYDATVNQFGEPLVRAAIKEHPAKPLTQKEKIKQAVSVKEKSIKEIAEETKILEPSVRKILGIGAKDGTFERVDKGVYVLKTKDGKQTAWIEAGAAQEVLPKMVEAGEKFDSVFLDPAYFSEQLIGRNRLKEKNWFDFITPKDFGEVMQSVSKLVDEDNHVYVMLSGAKSAQKDMAKYVDGIIAADFKLVGEGGYTKLDSKNNPVKNIRGEESAPERLMLFTKSGEARAGEIPINLNFRFLRPSIKKSYQTEKPKELLKALIQQSTLEGETILDPFAGSGVTGEQAIQNGRNVKLVEKSADVVENVIKPRVEAAANKNDQQEAITAKPVSEKVKSKFEKLKTNSSENKSAVKQATVIKTIEDKATDAADSNNEAAASEVIQSIDELINQTPDQQARTAGEKVVDGTVVKRQEPLTDAVIGKPVDILFTKDDKEPAHYAVIERSELQPSHKSGVVNENHFIPEAQPRDRGSLEVLKNEAKNKADKLDPNQLADNNIAYFGAPVINDRGEVIQGNGRAEAVDYYYGNNKNDSKGYRDMLQNKAADLGLDAEAISKMKEPVLVKMTKANDERAIQLGNYKASELEDVQQKGADIKAAFNRLTPAKVKELSDAIGSKIDENTTLKQIIRDNVKVVLDKLFDLGALRKDNKEQYIKDGEVTPDGIQAAYDIVRKLLFEGGASDLEQKFDTLPFNTREAIEKTIPAILNNPELKAKVQEAIEIMRDQQESGTDSFATWRIQRDIFGDQQMPADKYDKSLLDFAQGMTEAKSQKPIAERIIKLSKEMNGSPADMFDAAKPGKRFDEAYNQDGIKFATLQEGSTEFQQMKGIVRDIQNEYAAKDESITLDDIKGIAKKELGTDYNEQLVEEAYHEAGKENKAFKKATGIRNELANRIQEFTGSETTVLPNSEALQKKAEDLQNGVKFQITDNSGKKINVQSIPGVENGFYSPLEKTINQSKQDKMPAKQWLEKFGTGEEAKWTGLQEWLKQQTGSVSKEDIQKFLKDNRVEVVEVVKSSQNGKTNAERLEDIKTKMRSEFGYQIESDMAGEFYLSKDGHDIFDDNEFETTVPEAAKRLFEDFYEIHQEGENRENTATGVQYSSYQLEGEKNNYKEVLITLPQKEETYEAIPYNKKDGEPLGASKGDWLIKNNKGEVISYVEKDYASTADDAMQEFEANQKGHPDSKEHLNIPLFKSGHFKEPNILAHVRMNNRVDAEGKKVLFLEEIQSDWAQSGRDKGFAQPKQEFDKNKVEIKRTERTVVVHYDGKRVGVFDKENPTFNKSDQELTEMLKKDLNNEYDKYTQHIKGQVANAPFVTDTNAWTKLAFKVALKEAVKEGADKIAWTTGEQQADRYDLSKQVSAVSYAQRDNGNYDLKYIAKGARSEWTNMASDIPASEIEKYVGKDLAKKITGDLGKKGYGPFKTFDGVDLKVGGEGMKGFYGSTEKGKLGIVGEVAKSLFKQTPKILEIRTSDKERYEVEDKNGYVSYFNSKELADKFIKENDGSKLIKQDESNSAQYSIEISSQLKSQVQEEGQPLFMKDKDGKILGFTHDGKIYLNGEHLNPNTPIHEAGHIWVEVAKEKMPAVYKRGIELINGSNYLKKTLANDIYQQEAQKLPKSERKAYFEHEALAAAIGDKGAQFITEARRKSFIDWATDLWNKIANIAGFKNVTAKELQDMTLEDFSKRAAGDILKGKEPVEEVKPPEPPSTKNEPGTAGTGEPVHVSHAGMQDIADDFGLSDVQSREHQSDIQDQEQAATTAKQWHDEGTYAQNIDRLLSNIESGKGSNPVDKAILQQHIANVREDVAKIKNIYSKEYDDKISELDRLKKAGALLKSTAGATLRDSTLFSEANPTMADWMADRKEVLGVDELTPGQKGEVQNIWDDYEAKLKIADEKVNEAQQEIERLKAELSVRTEKGKRNYLRSKNREELKVERKKIIETIQEKLKKARGETNAALVPYAKELFAIAPDVSKLVTNLIDTGISKLADIVDNVHETLRDAIPGITKRDVLNIIAGDYNKEKPTLTALQLAKKDVIEEAKLIKKLEALQNGTLPPTEKKMRERNKEITDLRAKIKEYRKYDQSSRTPEQILNSIKKANEKRQKEIEEKIANKDFSPPKKKVLFHENAALKMANPELYRQTMDAINAKDEAGHQFEALKAKDELSKRGIIKKYIVDPTGKVITTLKSIKAGVDDSVTAVQLLMAVLANPRSGIKAKIEAFKDINNTRFKRELASLHNSVLWPIIQGSGLDITEPQSFGKKEVEELYSGNLLDNNFKIPFTKGKVNPWTYTGGIFERIFTSMGNNLRLNLFYNRVEMLENQGKTFDSHPEEYKGAARAINELTARGKLPVKLQSSMEAISPIIWAPRMLASTFNTLGITDAAALVTGKKGVYRTIPKQQSRYLAWQMSKGIGMGVGIMAAFAMRGWGVDYDPRSNTFGNITSPDGNTKYNVFGRYSSLAKSMVQMVGGVRTESSGKETDIDKTMGARGGVLWKFVRGKMTPATGIFSDYWLNNKTNMFTKQPITLSGLPNDLITPISVSDLTQGLKNDGAISILTRFLPALEGVQVSDQRDYKTIASSLSDKTVQYLKDKNVSEPYFNPRQIDIKQEKNGKGEIKKLSDLDEVTQVKYEKTHSEIFEKELNNVKHSFVFKDIYGNISLNTNSTKDKQVWVKNLNGTDMQKLVSILNTKASEKTKEQLFKEYKK